jgi:hypothetical protein
MGWFVLAAEIGLAWAGSAATNHRCKSGKSGLAVNLGSFKTTGGWQLKVMLRFPSLPATIKTLLT